MTPVILLWVGVCALGLIMVAGAFHAAMVDYQLVRVLHVNGLNHLVSLYILRMEALRIVKLALLLGLGVGALISQRAASLAVTPVLFTVVALIVVQAGFDRRLRVDVKRLL